VQAFKSLFEVVVITSDGNTAFKIDDFCCHFEAMALDLTEATPVLVLQRRIHGDFVRTKRSNRMHGGFSLVCGGHSNAVTYAPAHGVGIIFQLQLVCTREAGDGQEGPSPLQLTAMDINKATAESSQEALT